MIFNDIILKRDALQIIKTIKAERNNWSKFGYMVNGIKEDLRQLKSWSIVHVKRNVNKAAHTIARETVLCVINKVWVEETRNCICDIVGWDYHVPN
jgi:hypothetical protein